MQRPHSESDSDNNNCNMVGLLGILIQIGLGLLSFSVLLVKRLRESPPRPWNIWMFDTSKQGVSQMLAHFINLTISIALTYQDTSSDQCLWYFTTNILDNTVGVLFCVFCLVIIERRLIKKGRVEYISGNYYTVQKVFVTIDVMQKPVQQEHRSQLSEKVSSEAKEAKLGEHQVSIQIGQDHRAELVEQKQIDKISDLQLQSHPGCHSEVVDKIAINYKAWLVQLLIWISIVIVNKGILFGFQIALEDSLKNVTFSLMGWIEQYQVLQLVVVIVIVPVIMNGLAFWVQDNFLKKQDLAEREGEQLEQHSSQKQQQKYQIM